MPPVCRHTYCTSVCCPYSICSPYVMGTWGASIQPICLGVFGGHQYICQAFLWLSVHPFASKFITVILAASHHCGLLLYWTGCQLMSALLPFFVVFIMSHASITTAMTTTPPVTLVCSSTLSLLPKHTTVPSLMRLPAMSGQHDVVLPPPLTPRHSGCVVGFAIVLQQQPSSQMPLQAYGNYAMDPSQVGFSF